MKGLYLLLDGLLILVPVALSFGSRIHYFEKWRSVLFASIVVAVPFLIWDSIFIETGFWGFNPDYLVGLNVGNLPIEEVLFFFVIPFACTFIYECCKYYLQPLQFKTLDRLIGFTIPVYALILTLIEPTGWYTLSVVVSSGIVLFLWLRKNQYRYMGIAFLISLVPFLIVNAVLTGAVTSEPVVWYNELQKVSPRIWTIPMENVLYSFTLVISVFLLTEFFEKKHTI